jgi:hypothetical protein
MKRIAIATLAAVVAVYAPCWAADAEAGSAAQAQAGKVYHVVVDGMT